MNVVLINASPKHGDSASKTVLQALEKRLDGARITWHESASGDAPALLGAVNGCDALVFAFPLYVDGIPANLLRHLEQICPTIAQAAPRAKVYALVNNGFYDGRQNALALEMMRHFTKEAGLAWGQGLGIGAGGMMHSAPIGAGPLTRLGNELDALSDAILQKRSAEDVAFDPNFPRFLYMRAAHLGWRLQAKKNGLKRGALYERY